MENYSERQKTTSIIIGGIFFIIGFVAVTDPSIVGSITAVIIATCWDSYWRTKDTD